MPIFYYSATFDESLAALGDLCERGFRVIPGHTFELPVAPEYDRVTEDLVELLREGPGFYLAGAFTRFPVQLTRLEGGPADGKYVVNASAQGPVIDGLLARLNVADGAPTLLLGFLSRQDQYKNPETGLWEEASAELKAAYKLAVSTMKKRLVKVETAKFLVGIQALRLVQEGKACLREYFTT